MRALVKMASACLPAVNQTNIVKRPMGGQTIARQSRNQSR